MSEAISSIRDGVAQRGITRLCHFTPSRNLGHITEDPRGILASRHLAKNEKAVFNPTDLARLDGHPDHVCCSIQYPNAWYFKTARNKEKLFRDWVILLIDARYLWGPGAKFCPRNAAAEHGTLIREGVEGFEALFAVTVEGAGNRVFRRSPRQPGFLPTDEQAEILIPDHIQRHDIIGIAVYDDAQAKRELARLKLLDQEPPPVVIVPQFYDPYALSAMLRAGHIPVERKHQKGADDAG